MISRRPFTGLFALVCTLLLSACGGDGTDVEAVTSVSVSPTNSSLTSLGETQQLSASARDMSGDAVTGSELSFTWASSASTVATVSTSGLVSAVADGTATITATASGSGASGSATITVAQAASTISITLADDTLTAGQTAQASAEVADAGGTAMVSPNLSWSSSDPSIATVDASGLVTGVGDGAVTITASQDGATGTGGLVVIRPNLTVAADTTLGGTVVVGELTIAEGTTVTMANDMVIDAKLALTIAGTLTGDCLGVSITGDGSVTVSGTINNACATQTLAGDSAPTIDINAPAGVDLTDATIVSSGPITVSSAPSSAFLAQASGRESTGGMAQAALLGTISLAGTTLRAEPAAVPQPEYREGGYTVPHAADIKFEAAFDLILDGTTIIAQHGGPGLPIIEESASPLVAWGQAAGGGGDIIIDLPAGATIHLESSRGESSFIAGNGGAGGPGTATTTQNADLDEAPSADAYGGEGGSGGSVEIRGDGVGAGDMALFTRQVGFGGSGGNATATAADGVAATSTRAAQVGGWARASAGRGGRAGSAFGGFVGMPDADPKEGGRGGTARATGGRGGDGIRSNPNGAVGGTAEATGGESKNAWKTTGTPGGEAIAAGGNGGTGADVCSAFTESSLSGQISVGSDPASSDQFIFNAGSGIALGLVYRVLNGLAGPGGEGGGGALLSAKGGKGGFGRDVDAPNGGSSLGAGGNGGDGGAGSQGGSGGAAGAPGEESDVDALRLDPIFQTGSAGGSCASLVEGLALTTSNADQAIEINGTGAWVDVTGTLSDDGTVTGSGRGTVAGVADILVEFAGTWDAETNTLAGTYTIDSEKVISSGHPVVYNVNVAGS